MLSPVSSVASDTQSTEKQIVELIPTLRAFAVRFERRGPQADDLVQETLLRALGSIHQFQPGTQLKSWLFRIMRNVFFTTYNKSQREPVGSTECVSLVETAVEPTQEISVRGREVLAALNLIAEERRNAILLIADGTSYEEAALAINCALGTLKSRVNRGRLDLVHALRDSSL